MIVLFSLGAGCVVAGRLAPAAVTEPAADFDPISTSLPSTIVPERATDTPNPTPTPVPFEPLSFSASDCDYGGAFKAIEAVDAHTVRFTLCKPDPAFLAKIAFPTFGIQPQEWLEQTGGGGQNSDLLVKPVGTGPYMLDEWKRGEVLTLKAFDRYWGEEKALTPNLVFHWNFDEAQRLLELQTGTVQGIDNVYSMDFAAVQDDPNLALLTRPPLNTFYIGINNNQPPLDNEKVRQALAMGIDRALVLENSFPPGYEVASFFAPCTLPNACVGEPWYDFDPVTARDLLAEAGYPDGFEVELAYRDVVRSYLPRPARVAKEIQTQLQKNLNVQVKLKAMDSQEYLQAVDAGTLTGLFLLGWGADYPDVSNFLDFNFGSQAPPQFGKPYDDIVDALQKGAASFGDEARQPYYETANLLIRQHVPAIPVSHGGWALPDDLAVAYARAVEGAHASPLGVENFSLVQVPGQDTFTWMQAVEPRSLYCADETEVESLRVCAQIMETLYRYETGGVAVQPGLAEACEPSPDLTIWNCSLRKDVIFQDGSALDANDVVLSFAVQWDAASPLHKGNSGNFAYFKSFWGAFMNASQP